MKKQAGLIIWPAYFDAAKKRSEGRRLPVKLALENPTTSELLEVCKALSLKAEQKGGKRYPRTWWDDSDPILVESAGTKSKVLPHIAMKLRELRKNVQRRIKESEHKSKRK